MIKAIVFDLSGVIFTRMSNIHEILEPIIGLKKDEITLKMKNKSFYDFLEGKINEDDYWKKIIGGNSWNISIDELKKAMRDNFREIEGTLNIIKKLKKNGFLLGLLSSHTKEWTQYLNQKYDYEKYFDGIVYSFNEGDTKTNISLYKEILFKLKVSSYECIYIDDKEKYIEPAKILGMKTILFEDSEKLKNRLNYFLR